MKIGSKKQDTYDQYSYAGLINRIRDGVCLTEHQRKRMAECGLNVDDFRNQKSEEEKIAILNSLRKGAGVQS